MNPLSILINSGSTISGTGTAGATEATPLAKATNGALFKTALTASTASLFLGKASPASSTAAASTSTLDADLVQRIRASLDRGTSSDDVVTSLASSLAASVATALGISTDAAKAKLTQVFRAALAPSGSSPPQTNAERAATLAQRFRQIAELATRVTKEDPGHTIRSITGTSSDAEQAGAAPAPLQDRIIRDAIAALAVPASSATPTSPSTASTASAPTVAPATAGDGKVVTLEPAPLIATGGDTLLGRILARGLANDPQATGPTATPVTAPSDDVALATVAAGTARSAADPLRAGPNPSPDAPALAGSTSTPRTASDPLQAFVSAFAAAVRREEGPRSTSIPESGFPSIPVDPNPSAGMTATPQQVAPMFAAPAAPDATSIAPPAPAQTLPQQAPVDANAVVDQVLRGVNIRTSDGSSEVRLRLAPESLGDVSIKLVVTGGSVDASITTHTADAQNALAGAQTQLAKSFADAGLKLQSFTVALSGGAFSGNRDQQSSSQSWTNRSTRRIGAVDAFGADENDDLGLLAVPSFGPPIFAANPAHGFNYLV